MEKGVYMHLMRCDAMPWVLRHFSTCRLWSICCCFLNCKANMDMTFQLPDPIRVAVQVRAPVQDGDGDEMNGGRLVTNSSNFGRVRQFLQADLQLPKYLQPDRSTIAVPDHHWSPGRQTASSSRIAKNKNMARLQVAELTNRFGTSVSWSSSLRPFQVTFAAQGLYLRRLFIKVEYQVRCENTDQMRCLARIAVHDDGCIKKSMRYPYVLASSDAIVNKALTQIELTCISRVKDESWTRFTYSAIDGDRDGQRYPRRV
ncbi:Transcription factor SPT8 [Fusarium oxysporum f. sp. albedinis]|nr:Transcription factor SPT8 [Fusarium oxysporum f. sp. albedinis]